MSGYEDLERNEVILADLHDRLDQEDLAKNDRQVDTEIWTAQSSRERECRLGIENFVKFGKQFGVTVAQAAAYFAVREEFVEQRLTEESDQNPNSYLRPLFHLRGNRYVHRSFISN